MDWDKLRIFQAAAEAGSFTHAGDRLHMSQSAVSRQVSSLELDLGISLFHRHARGLLLTEQGELLFQTANDVMHKLAATRATLKDAKEKPSGNLRVTTTVGLGSTWLTDNIGDFVKTHPDIKLQLSLGDADLDLGMRQADVAIRLHQPTQPDLIQRRLFVVHFHICASAEYLAEFGTPQTLEDLDRNNHRILAFGEPTPTHLRDLNWLMTGGRPTPTPREPFLLINSVVALKRATNHGLGIAMLPDYIISKDTALIRLFPDFELPSLETYFVYPEELKNSARINVFRDFLLAQAKKWKF
ncbi:MAG: LysR family transcriptional regulator [Cohaesibacteraceae bacterium]|nr:LysR family transcriptional regulator [Cohaesibacteraceae bacterium]MBL4875745.1 LysR family transcriptional regulator [Cohaesibacteraceae bacterium]